MVIVHLLASPFYGGPEKQMLGLARSLPESHRSVFLTFAERGLCRAFLEEVHKHGFEGIALAHNAPRFAAAVGEVADHLRRLKADVLVCSGYKPDIIGLFAARRANVPVVSVAHGWTSATWKVRLNERVDRYAMRWMDKVVCVSEAQAAKVRKAGVAEEKIAVIHNAVGDEAFTVDAAYQQKLLSFFDKPYRYIIGAAGRLSPEKGFEQLVKAAMHVKDAGFIVFGEGPLRESLTRQIEASDLRDRFILAGFHADASKYFGHFDVLALPSYTEGLPVVILEAMAAGVPVVATRVGGVPEVVADGRTGYLVAPGDASALAQKISEVLGDGERRKAMGEQARRAIQSAFSCRTQAEAYEAVFASLSAKICARIGPFGRAIKDVTRLENEVCAES